MGSHRLLTLVVTATLLGIAHHLEHIARGVVGWPLSDELNPFTYSLGFYVLIAIGLVLARRGRVGPGFWAVIAGAGTLVVGINHLTPIGQEPPGQILGAYRSPAAGLAAFLLVLTFVAALATTTVYAAYLWARRREAAVRG